MPIVNRIMYSQNARMENLKKQIGSRIKELRKNRGLTQVELAEELLKSIETISNFERGKVMPGIGTLYQICYKSGVNLRDFFNFLPDTIERNEHGETKNLKKSIDQMLMEMDIESLEHCKHLIENILYFKKK